MAPESGKPDSAVTPPETQPETQPVAYRLAGVERELRERFGRFDFFQAVRLITRMFEDRQPVGDFSHPGDEVLRFHVNNSLAFPPTEIFSIDWDQPSPHMTVNFMGLTGPVGVLPYTYTEFLAQRIRERDRAMVSFFDIFNHRIISLFYLAWEKYRSAVAYERDGQDRLSQYLACLVGIGTGGLQDRLVVRDESLLYYTGLLSLLPRSAAALRQVLEDYFEVSVEVEQFVGAWQALSESDQCLFEFGSSFSEQLGVGAVVGDEIWDQQSRIRLRLGPLSEERYLGFLPGGTAATPLRDLTRFFCGKHLEVEVQLVLEREEVPRCDLGKADLAGPRLGWLTWMKSGADFDRSPADTILHLD
jgi:type VI secretion system protein ImpH